MPEIHKKVDGVWQQVTQIGYTDVSTLRELDEVWYNDNGLWRQVFDLTEASSIVLTATSIGGNRNTSGGSGTATASVIFNSDGTVDKNVNTTSGTDGTTVSEVNNGNWWSAKPVVGVGSDYEIFVSANGGNADGSFTGTLDTWLALSSNRTFTLTDTGNNVERFATRIIAVKIRDATTLVETGPVDYTLSAILFGP